MAHLKAVSLAIVFRSACRWLRQVARKVPFIRNFCYLALELREALLDGPARNRAQVEEEFGRRTDPWDYDTSPKEKERFARQQGMLALISPQGTLGRVLEVGCAEGAFTEILAPRCESLLAVDLSAVAVARARQRCYWHQGVCFGTWNLRTDPLPGTFDVIVATGVLEYLARPAALRAARDKLVAGLRTGGHLLVTTTRGSGVVEHSWWGKRLRRGRWINAHLAQHLKLEVVAEVCSDWYIISLFRKRPLADLAQALG